MNTLHQAWGAHKKFLLVLFFGSLLLRALFFLYFTQHGTNAWIYVDSDQYHAIASNLAAGKGISLIAGAPQHYRLPGYPLFLAGCYKVFGVWPTAALWAQLVLASLLPLLVFMLGFVSCGSLSVAFISALVACVHPGLILYAGMLATESLTVLLLLLFFIFFFHRQSVFDLVAAGMFLGLASLVRPVGHYVLVLAVGMLFMWRPSTSMRHAGAVMLGWLLAVAPWLIRNFLLTGAFFFHSLPGLHFVQYLAAPIVAQRDHYSYPQARAIVLSEWGQRIKNNEHVLGHALNDYQRCCQGEVLARSYVKRYPGYALKHATIEMFKTGFGLYSAIILLADGVPWPAYEQATSWDKIKRFLCPRVRRPLLVPFIYLEILLHALLVLGMCLLLLAAVRHTQARALLFALAPFIFLFIGLTLAYGGARLRMPIEPLLIIGAVYGWLWLFGRGECV